MIAAVYDHRGVAQPFIRALRAAGHATVDVVQALDVKADVLVIDLDHANYQHIIDRHERVVLIPHGAGPHSTPVTHPHVQARVVTAPGNVPDDGFPTEVIGWPWTPLQPFRPCPAPKRILLAPMHPDNDGHVDPFWRAAESRALDVVLAAAPAGVNLTYRPGPSTIPLAAEACAAHDLVVAAPGSIVAAAVAAGTPVVTYRQDRYDSVDFGYPHDLAGGARAVLAALTDAPDDWRRQHVGGPFDPDLFVTAVEKVAAA